MSEWKEYKLSDVADNFAMGPFGSNIKAENFKSEGVPVIRGKNLNYYRYVGGDFIFLTEKKADELKSSNCFPGDLVFTHRGTIGQVGLIPSGKFHRYVVSQSGMKVTPNAKFLDNMFLFYFFKSDIGQHELLQHESQVGVPSISSPLTSLKSVNILLPPLPEQKAIAGVLSSLDDKIDLLHRQNKTLEAMAEALFRQWFVEPCKDGLPEGWEEKTLGEIADIKAGGDKPNVFSVTKTNSCNIPIYSNGTNNEGLYGFTDSAKIDVESITISARGTIGYVCLRQEPYFPIVRLISIVPNEKFVSNKYLYLWAKSQIISGTGTTQQQLTVPDFSRSNLTLPPFEIMKEFTMCVDEFFKKIQFNKNQIRTLEKLRETLIPKLMSGEVKVAT